MRTSSAWRLKRLNPAASRAASRCSTVVSRMGSTEWIRNGSMIVRHRSMSPRIGARAAPDSADPVVHPSAGKAVSKSLAQPTGHVPGATGHVRAAILDLRNYRPAVVAERHPRAARQGAMRDADVLRAAPVGAEHPAGTAVAVEAGSVPADVGIELPEVADDHPGVGRHVPGPGRGGADPGSLRLAQHGLAIETSVGQVRGVESKRCRRRRDGTEVDLTKCRGVDAGGSARGTRTDQPWDDDRGER